MYFSTFCSEYGEIVAQKIPLSSGGSRYPCILTHTVFPECTFSMRNSSGSSITSHLNKTVNLTCIPGAILCLSTPALSNSTMNFELGDLFSILYLTVEQLTFFNSKIFYSNRNSFVQLARKFTYELNSHLVKFIVFKIMK